MYWCHDHLYAASWSTAILHEVPLYSSASTILQQRTKSVNSRSGFSYRKRSTAWEYPKQYLFVLFNPIVEAVQDCFRSTPFQPFPLASSSPLCALSALQLNQKNFMRFLLFIYLHFLLFYATFLSLNLYFAAKGEQSRNCFVENA